MVALEETRKYQKELRKFIKNNPQLLPKIIKALELFMTNPYHPGLNTEKLSGTDMWTIRVDRGNRIYFTWAKKNIAILVDIGTHDKYRLY